ncbi:hypothetical protein [Micromonospora sp. DT47]|uniref:hypothetical protein n=1 Tax=Micromonospora sp. DT47 TaxID=3393431 RepID=UPI003CEA0A58
MDQTTTRPARPALDDLTRSLHTPLGRVAAEHADLVEQLRRRLVPSESTPPVAVPVAAFNSSI